MGEGERVEEGGKLGTMLPESSLAKMASYLGSGRRNAREREEPPLSSPDWATLAQSKPLLIFFFSVEGEFPTLPHIFFKENPLYAPERKQDFTFSPP